MQSYEKSLKSFYSNLEIDREKSQPFLTLETTKAFLEQQKMMINYLIDVINSYITPDIRYYVTKVLKYAVSIFINDINIAILSYPDDMSLQTDKEFAKHILDYETLSNSTKK